ncbi:MAG: YeeE/YedE thiosulfate transporter family protein [Paracoccaceae bacterium]
MQADWLWGLAGGFIIGTAAALYLLVNGRVMGASGILGGLVDGSGRTTAAERLAFIAGLVALPAVAAPLLARDETHVTPSLALVVIAGLLVGIGTRLANGCTSGHGVCGISRLSRRGLAATLFYLLGGGIAVLVLRHVLGAI